MLKRLDRQIAAALVRLAKAYLVWSYRREIAKGKWTYSPEIIRFNDEGTLIDGHGRFRNE